MKTAMEEERQATKRAHAANVRHAVDRATSDLRRQLREMEEQRIADDAACKREQSALTDELAQIEDSMTTLEETTEAAQQRARRITALAEAKARELASRLRKEKENRSAILEAARQSIRRKEEENVCGLMIADYDGRLTRARCSLRDAKTRRHVPTQTNEQRRGYRPH